MPVSIDLLLFIDNEVRRSGMDGRFIMDHLAMRKFKHEVAQHGFCRVLENFKDFHFIVQRLSCDMRAYSEWVWSHIINQVATNGSALLLVGVPTPDQFSNWSKEIRRIALQCGEGLLALRCEKVLCYFSGTMKPGDALHDWRSWEAIC